MRVPAADRAVGVLDDQEELGLDADVEDVAPSPRLAEHALELDARAIRVGLAVDVEIRGKPGDAGLVGQRRIRLEVGPGEHVVRVRSLAHAPDGPAREAGAGFGHRLQGLRGHELDLGRSVDVDELDQQEGDPVVLQSVFEPG